MSQAARREKILDFMDRQNIRALLLSSPANFAWYTDGADNRVDHSSPEGVAALLITRETEYVLTNNIEAGRMREEQTSQFEVVEYPWHEGNVRLLNELAGDARLGADGAADGAEDVSKDITPLRYVLDEEAVERYREVGADAVAATDEAAAVLESGVDEREAAAELSAACRRRGLFTPVLLAASGERFTRYRHPIPYGGPLGARCMLVVCAERGGLYANLTRLVHFEDPDPETARRQKACEEILRRMREEVTGEGRTLADIFTDCRRFYAEEGYPDGVARPPSGRPHRVRAARDDRGTRYATKRSKPAWPSPGTRPYRGARKPKKPSSSRTGTGE